jgi:hypothetical protein
MQKRIDLTLPEWAFLDAHTHEGNALGNRTIIYHVRSATVIEILDRDLDVFGLKPGGLWYKFKNTRSGGRGENLIAVVHYCATLDVGRDRDLIKAEVLIPCARWYCDYCDWEDQNILSGDL